jgi:hypothetical protein
MDEYTHYDFRIDAWGPKTLPMAKLAVYIGKLAVIFGYEEHVHFIKVRKGSAIPEIIVDREAALKVAGRLYSAQRTDAPQDIVKARQEIDRMLRVDNASATLGIKKGAKILDFPGRKTPLAEEFTVYEEGEFDGQVIRVGGKDESVPVWIQGEDGEIYICTANRQIARELAQCLFDRSVRVSGNGKWRRTSERVWQMDAFNIRSWEPLEEKSLTHEIEGFRAIEGSDWNRMDDPQGEWKKLRGD